MDKKNRKEEIRREPAPQVSDEEYAEKIYEVEAPVPPQFDEPHRVSYTGQPLHRGTPSGVDAPPPESAE
jgi:hypothetical protein